jgi:hypothetical protein
MNILKSNVAWIVVAIVSIAGLAFVDQPLSGEDHQMRHQIAPSTSVPQAAGQDAFGAIQEIVEIPEADPNTDWSKVNIENLRQHLIDMNEVVLHSEVKSSEIPAGLVMEVTGKGRTEQAIKSMVVPHAGMLTQIAHWSAQTEEMPGGIRLTVTAKDPQDTKTIAKIRGLGFGGLLVEGRHQQLHHLAMAKGEFRHSHQH